MLTVWLIILTLLSVAALGFSLWRARQSERAGASLAGALVELREKFLRELSALRERLDSESRRSERHEARLSELTEAEERREAEAERALESASRSDEMLYDGAARDEVRAGDGSSAVEAGEASSGVAVDARDAYALARSIEDFFNATTHPREFLDSDAFIRGVEVSKGVENSTFTLLARSTDTDIVVACMSLEALARREGVDDSNAVTDSIVRDINAYFYWPRFFALRALAAHAGGSHVLARLLARINASWRDYMPLQMLREFVALRLSASDSLTTEQLIREIESQSLNAEQVSDVELTIRELGFALPAGFDEELARWNGEREAVEFLKTFGRVWGSGGGRGETGGEVFLLDPVAARVAELESALKREPPRSVLLVGESGTGKTATLRALAERLRGERWIVFEAGASEVLAGQQYIGQLEERVRSIVRQIGGKRVLWVVPNFHETMWAGRHKYSPVGVLDLLLPSIESGAVRVVGEVPSNAYEQLVRLRPKLRTAMQTCRVVPLADEETLELGRRWVARREVTKHAWEGMHEGVDTSYTLPRVTEQNLREALQLAKQYLGDKAAPGNLMLLLDATHRRLVAEERSEGEITLDDLLVTLSQLTGLPVSILDEREGLDLAELRAFFERRVLGQPEAVDCLVERVAMIKAGLTDPTRPQGVFLFVGPTGTGKTEIAKTLAEFLFGSHERMIRLDMSELQTWETQARVLGE
ncbi:MAG TPA: AAA family ATPase, partial [Pyrinomonadaceae bacterium]|nr:AAA family ATPase [Pyrinomonadaceae bacterium]